jgi:hypothetical protein
MFIPSFVIYPFSCTAITDLVWASIDLIPVSGFIVYFDNLGGMEKKGLSNHEAGSASSQAVILRFNYLTEQIDVDFVPRNLDEHEIL